MTYRLLHTADLHLDRAFAVHGCHGALARRRRTGLRDALQIIGDRARALDCDAVTIAGDLYEHERAGVDTAAFLAATFESWRPMRVLAAPGNHDALLPGSLWRRVEWPENVHVFDQPALAPLVLADGLTLWGLAHREPAWTGNPLDVEDPPTAASGVHLALFHGAELTSLPEGKSIHGPFRAAEVRERGFDLALCGHYHRRRIDTDAALIYPGSPEPLTFDETGRRGPVLVEIDGDGSVRHSAVDSNRWTASCPSCDVSACTSTTDLLGVAAQACASAAGADPERALVRLDLLGRVDCRLSIDTAWLEAEARERSGSAQVQVRDLTQAAIDFDAVSEERSARGAFVRAVIGARQAATDEEQSLLDDALRYGLEALAGAEVGLR